MPWPPARPTRTATASSTRLNDRLRCWGLCCRGCVTGMRSLVETTSISRNTAIARRCICRSPRSPRTLLRLPIGSPLLGGTAPGTLSNIRGPGFQTPPYSASRPLRAAGGQTSPPAPCALQSAADSLGPSRHERRRAGEWGQKGQSSRPQCVGELSSAYYLGGASDPVIVHQLIW